MDRLSFNYDYEPDLSEASLFDLFVTDPDGKAHRNEGWATAKEAGTKFLAYLSWYEIGPTDPYLGSGHKLLKEAKKRGIKVLADNPRWHSKIMDTANSDWQALFMELVFDAEQKGYAGIYFDTWDGYGDIPKLGSKKREKLLESNVEILYQIRAAHPHLDLMLNRGWEVMRKCADYSDRMLVESVWSTHEGGVKGQETEELLRKIVRARTCGYNVNILDYVPSGDSDLAKQICAKASAVGCGCTVVKSSLTSPELLAVAP